MSIDGTKKGNEVANAKRRPLLAATFPAPYSANVACADVLVTPYVMYLRCADTENTHEALINSAPSSILDDAPA